jgi:uncharacterized protein (DUF1501 family)
MPNLPLSKQVAITRRLMLGLSGGMLGSLWANWARTMAAPLGGGKAKSVILIFNCGGPSHIDLWDPKPDAGENVRGPFSTISTKVPGIFVTELIPKLAARADKLAIVRTMHHTQGNHNSAMYYAITGYPYRIDSTLINPSPDDMPSVGTLVGWLAQRDGYSGAVPPYVITPYPHCDSEVYITPGQFGSCLGVRFDPLVVNADPARPDFRVRNLAAPKELTPDRLQDRMSLLDQLGAAARIHSSDAAALEEHRKKAAQMTLSGDASRAFDLSLESPKTRERYGRHTWGQSHLLARRLIEAGTKFVTTVNGHSIIWDTHADNFNRMKKSLVPPMEQAYVALLDDLEERGLLDETLVVWMGDFGRTPTINKDAGRDHWPQCGTVVFAGGGVRGGQVIGKSDKMGAYPVERPVTPADIHASVFAALGYDPQGITFSDLAGRPTPLSHGTPISELF